jgi:glycosyltransferase involved in cell wall biosynthesis
MRILISSAHRNLVGGVEKYLQSIIPALDSQGHELGLFCEYQADPKRERIDPPGLSMRVWCLEGNDRQAALASIAEWDPDIVYHHGFDRPDAVGLEDALFSAYPVALYVHNYDRTCGTGQKCFMFPHAQVCERKIGPACLLLHYPRRCGGLRPDILWNNFRRHAALSARLPRHQAVLVASAHMHAEMVRHDVPADKLHLLPLPVGEVIAESPPSTPRPFSSKILFVGRLTNLKGADYLIRAMPIASRQLGRLLTLTIAGDGPARPKIENLARELGVQVEFRGWLHSRDKLNLMAQVDLLAVPSLWPEPFGLVGIEAGGVGLPAVGYATGGIPDWLVGGETGELAPSDPPSAEGLADAIVRALGSPEHYGELCIGAWQMAKRFTMASHLERLESLLASIAKPSQPTQPAGALSVLGSR